MTVNNRWFQLVASLIAMIMIANLQYAWTLFVRPMQASTGWALSDVQWAFTLFVLFQTWVQPVDGWLIDRMGSRAQRSSFHSSRQRFNNVHYRGRSRSAQRSGGQSWLVIRRGFAGIEFAGHK